MEEDITRLLLAWSGGEEKALDELLPLVHGNLRRLAASYLRAERADHTLQTHALVNEAYLRLVDQGRVTWRSRAHFFAIAAQMMRRILVDHARSHGYAKRGGGLEKLSLDDAEPGTAPGQEEIVALDDALRELARHDPRRARMVELRFFGGMTKEEIAEVMEISPATVSRWWKLARAWLYSYLDGGTGPGG